MSKGIQIAIGATAIALLLGWYGTSQIERLACPSNISRISTNSTRVRTRW